MPEILADKRIVVLDLAMMVAGTKYRGQFEERLKGLLKELRQHPEVIVFIDAEVKNMVALLMMALILMFRPQGILGRAERLG